MKLYAWVITRYVNWLLRGQRREAFLRAARYEQQRATYRDFDARR